VIYFKLLVIKFIAITFNVWKVPREEREERAIKRGDSERERERLIAKTDL